MLRLLQVVSRPSTSVLRSCRQMPPRRGIVSDTVKRFPTLGAGQWSRLHGQSLLSTAQFDQETLGQALERATYMETNTKNGQRGKLRTLLSDRILGLFFFEPSTRTSSSFNSAMLRLGGTVLQPGGGAGTSAQKGETFEDSVRVMEQFADALAIRHPEVGSAARAAALTSIPILNAGDGIGEHPSQAILDIFTMTRELNSPSLNGRVITLVGDLKNGRTVHSLCQLLSFYKLKIHMIAPDVLKMPDSVVSTLEAKKVQVEQGKDLSPAVLKETDILYMTRVQKERFVRAEDYDAVKGCYVLKRAMLGVAKPTLRVMHPLPRVDEIALDVDADPRAAYFRQVQYGVYMRMALLHCILGKSKE